MPHIFGAMLLFAKRALQVHSHHMRCGPHRDCRSLPYKSLGSVPPVGPSREDSQLEGLKQLAMERSASLAQCVSDEDCSAGRASPLLVFVLGSMPLAMPATSTVLCTLRGGPVWLVTD